MRLFVTIASMLFYQLCFAQTNSCDKEILELEKTQLDFTDAAASAQKYQHYINKNRGNLSPDCSRRIYSLLANFLAMASSIDGADSAFKTAINYSKQCTSDTAEIFALIDYARFLNSVNTDSFKVCISDVYKELTASVQRNKLKFTQVLSKYPVDKAPPVFSASETEKISPSVIDDMPVAMKVLWRQYYELKGSSLIFSTSTDDAENCLHMALFFDRNNPEDDNESVSLSNLGLLYQNTGKHTTAVEYFLAAMEKNRKAGEDYAVINTLSNISYSYRVIKNYKVAGDYALQAVNLSRKLNITKNLCRALSQYASVFIDEGKYAEAEKHVRESIAISHSIDNKADLCYSMRKLAHLLINFTNRQAEGKLYADSSYYFAREIGDNSFFYYIDNTLANYYFKNGDLATALPKALSSYKQSVSYNDNELIVANLNLLYQLYEKQNNPAKALEYYKQYTALKDTALGKEVQFAITDMQEKYESQKKQIAIDKLEKEKSEKQRQTKILMSVMGVFLLLSGLFYFFNRKLNRQKKELQTTNSLLAEATATQNRLFGIIGHDLKGMVAPFSRAGKIMSNYIGKNNLQDAVTFSSKLEENAGRLSETLNNLLHWSLQQMKGLQIQKEQVDVHNAIQHVCSHYADVIKLKNINLVINVAAGEILFTDKEALQVILRNLFSNALKFTENNSITFSTTKAGDLYTISVADKGMGMTQEQAGYLFNLENKSSGKGTHGEGGSGLGMVVVQKMATALGASIKINSKLQAGTTIEITFNKAVL